MHDRGAVLMAVTASVSRAEALVGADDRKAQAMQALAKGNRVRLARAQIKRDLKAGRVLILAALDLDDAQGMKVYDLLMAQPRWGRERAHKVLFSVPLSNGKLLSELTDRQRASLRLALSSRRTERPHRCLPFVCGDWEAAAVIAARAGCEGPPFASVLMSLYRRGYVERRLPSSWEGVALWRLSEQGRVAVSMLRGES